MITDNSRGIEALIRAAKLAIISLHSGLVGGFDVKSEERTDPRDSLDLRRLTSFFLINADLICKKIGSSELSR